MRIDDGLTTGCEGCFTGVLDTGAPVGVAVLVVLASVLLPAGTAVAEPDSPLDAQTSSGFSVSDLSTPASATQGDAVTVTANVTNTGSTEESQSIDLRLDLDDSGTFEADETYSSESVSLASGETVPVEFELSTDSLGVGTYRYGVVSADDSQTAQLTVEEPASSPTPTPADDRPANFAVSDLSAPAEVNQSATVTVTANVTNTGDVEGTQTVSLRLDHDDSGTLDESETLAAKTVTLASGESETVEFEVTVGVDNGEYRYGVVTENDSQTGRIDVVLSYFFAVSDLDAPSSVAMGDSVNVTANVTNTGIHEVSSSASLRIDLDESGTFEIDETPTSESFRLAGGETTTVEFTFFTELFGLDVGTYRYAVVTTDDMETAQITVTEPKPANFSVTTLGAPSSTVQGETLPVTVGVTNVGGRRGSQSVDVRLDLDGDGVLEADETVTNRTVALGPDDSLESVLEVSTGDVSAGTFTYGVVTDNDTRTGQLTIEESAASPTPTPDGEDDIPANFSVNDLDAPSTVAQGKTVTVTANVTNTGSAEESQSIDLRIDLDGSGTFEADETYSSEFVTLAGGKTTPVEYELSTDSLDVGTYRYAVVTADDNQTAQLTVTEPEPANFSVTTLDAPASVEQDESLSITVGVTNVGGSFGRQSVDARVDFDGDGVLEADETVGNRMVALGPGDSEEDVIDVSTDGFPAGTYTYGVVTGNDTLTTQLTIEE